MVFRSTFARHSQSIPFRAGKTPRILLLSIFNQSHKSEKRFYLPRSSLATPSRSLPEDRITVQLNGKNAQGMFLIENPLRFPSASQILFGVLCVMLIQPPIPSPLPLSSLFAFQSFQFSIEWIWFRLHLTRGDGREKAMTRTKKNFNNESRGSEEKQRGATVAKTNRQRAASKLSI